MAGMSGLFLKQKGPPISSVPDGQMLTQIGLCARQAGILTMVTELEPITQESLADVLGTDRTTMVALLDDLEDKEFVARQRHPATGGRASSTPRTPAAPPSPRPCESWTSSNAASWHP
jgi:DNA-binding MarR family transcriptional regulator